MNLLTRLDTHIFQWLFSKTTGRYSRGIRMISRTGDGHVYLVLGLFLWAFESAHGTLFLYTGLLAYAMELPLYIMLKKLFKRERPCDVFKQMRAHMQPSDKFSLPSGHTAAAFLMANLLSHYYPAVGFFAYIWASLIAMSRILLGVHYPGDIIAGASLGFIISILSINILA